MMSDERLAIEDNIDGDSGETGGDDDPKHVNSEVTKQ